MKETTLVYIEKDSSVLMLHRIRKMHDVNHGKWIGVGGKAERGESPEECMRREVYEETGLLVDQYRYCGIVTFQSDDDETEYMHLFLVRGFHGQLKECDEGDLEWLPRTDLTRIPHWTGDRIFLSLIFGEAAVPFFSLKLTYRDKVLREAVLNEHACLVTDRLILRPWLETDASALYRAAANPHVGPAAGWLPHKSCGESLEVIRSVLSRPELYAIVLRDGTEPVGAIGFQNFQITDAAGRKICGFDERMSADPVCCTRQEAEVVRRMLLRSRKGSAILSDGCPQGTMEAGNSREVQSGAEEADAFFLEADLGYWLAESFWGQGIMQEAGDAVIGRGFEDLGLRKIWCRYYEGNERSMRCMERMGFHFHHREEHVYLDQLKEEPSEISCVLSGEDWRRMS